jgi:hypothetical protein
MGNNEEALEVNAMTPCKFVKPYIPLIHVMQIISADYLHTWISVDIIVFITLQNQFAEYMQEHNFFAVKKLFLCLVGFHYIIDMSFYSNMESIFNHVAYYYTIDNNNTSHAQHIVVCAFQESRIIADRCIIPMPSAGLLTAERDNLLYYT